MIEISVPGKELLIIKHLVLDYNGTLALGGSLLPGVADRIRLLSRDVDIHVVTADTFGVAAKKLEGLPLNIQLLTPGTETEQKRRYIMALGASDTIAIGNGANDSTMLSEAALGICILGPEGSSPKAMQAADIWIRCIQEGLDLLLNPKRITATLRE